MFTTVEVLWRTCKPVYMRERPRGCCEERAGLFKCQEILRNQVSALWSSCEARASLVIWGKDVRKPFYPPRRWCEELADLLKCQNNFEKVVFAIVDVRKDPKAVFTTRANLFKCRDMSDKAVLNAVGSTEKLGKGPGVTCKNSRMCCVSSLRLE